MNEKMNGKGHKITYMNRYSTRQYTVAEIRAAKTIQRLWRKKRVRTRSVSVVSYQATATPPMEMQDEVEDVSSLLTELFNHTMFRMVLQQYRNGEVGPQEAPRAHLKNMTDEDLAHVLSYSFWDMIQHNTLLLAAMTKRGQLDGEHEGLLLEVATAVRQLPKPQKKKGGRRETPRQGAFVEFNMHEPGQTQSEDGPEVTPRVAHSERDPGMGITESTAQLARS
ncbi:hypothetical protein J8273_0042 [Carpediemonas membranifera]|uniref:Uncharacterized protein n=1 Tax=Carpediemonas membranifera TaxID=201153 RepID=A0A8J6AXC8_9EUKA|nr:hypothetical protein J8273_0042 [Carpediemonas membranifera]|eukprot:KAG9394835.1 hypothetical protein J8273_0042 [Carpediemonas membranifera]